ncbi:MAG: hypothetical protein M8357_11045 [Desulfobulbaceae bacterium]|nr:hypothetical protein [Desulfobulbaceae bacterium]
MVPRLGEQFDIEVEVVSKPRQEYQTDAYTRSGLPKAPAIMVDNSVIVAGGDIDETNLIRAIQEHL